jgi:hypothetical protein
MSDSTESRSRRSAQERWRQAQAARRKRLLASGVIELRLWCTADEVAHLKSVLYQRRAAAEAIRVAASAEAERVRRRKERYRYLTGRDLGQ